jgi:hypothetical protein
MEFNAVWRQASLGVFEVKKTYPSNRDDYTLANALKSLGWFTKRARKTLSRSTHVSHPG